MAATQAAALVLVALSHIQLAKALGRRSGGMRLVSAGMKVGQLPPACVLCDSMLCEPSLPPGRITDLWHVRISCTPLGGSARQARVHSSSDSAVLFPLRLM